MSAFVNYLPKDKYELSVITLNAGNSPVQEEINKVQIYREENHQTIPLFKQKQGESRLKHYSKVLWNVLVHKLLPYPNAGWMHAVEKRLHTLNREKPIDLIISSFSPVEAHIASYNFLKNNTSIVWIADMRDEMASNKHIPEKTRMRLRSAEQLVNSRAQAITTVSKPILDDMKQIMNKVSVFEEIRNGFDHDIVPKNTSNAVFTLVYAGTFYGVIKPTNFFKGLKLFLEEHSTSYKIQFLGTHHNFAIPAEIAPHCEFIPPVNNLEAIEIMNNADATLLILPFSERSGVYSGKLFDYISLQKPIVALVDPGDVAAHLIRETNSGFIAHFNQPEEIKTAIENAYLVWKSGVPMKMESEQIRQLHRKYQVKKLEELIHKLLSL